MIDVEARVKGSSIIYKCPYCKGVHTHGYIPGELIAHRWSHCAQGDDSVTLHVRR
jgi:hypothetical protein